MSTRQRDSRGWLGKIADELYVGTLAAAAAIGLAAAVGLLLQLVLEFTHWAEQLDLHADPRTPTQDCVLGRIGGGRGTVGRTHHLHVAAGQARAAGLVV